MQSRFWTWLSYTRPFLAKKLPDRFFRWQRQPIFGWCKLFYRWAKTWREFLSWNILICWKNQLSHCHFGHWQFSHYQFSQCQKSNKVKVFGVRIILLRTSLLVEPHSCAIPLHKRNFHYSWVQNVCQKLVFDLLKKFSLFNLKKMVVITAAFESDDRGFESWHLPSLRRSEF